MTILASQSKLRMELLKSSGFTFESMDSGVDERSIERQQELQKPVDLVRALAEAKSSAVGEKHPDQVVVAADTVVALADGRILHKPRDLEDALRMAMLQSGKTVTIYTAVVVRKDGRALRNTTASRVTYENFTENVALSLFELHGLIPCNGALGFHADAPGCTLVRRFAGSYSGAMGLPMPFVRDALTKLGGADVKSNRVTTEAPTPTVTRKKVV